MIACVKHVQWSNINVSVRVKYVLGSNINVSVRVKYVLGSKLAISICDWMCEVCTRIIISNINLWLDVWSMYNDQISICDWMCEACTMIKYQFVIACVKHAQWSNINLWLDVCMYNDQISMWVYMWSMY